MVELSVDARTQLIKLVHEAAGDVLRELLSTMVHALMNAEVEVLCGARHQPLFRSQTAQAANSAEECAL